MLPTTTDCWNSLVRLERQVNQKINKRHPESRGMQGIPSTDDDHRWNQNFFWTHFCRSSATASFFGFSLRAAPPRPVLHTCTISNSSRHPWILNYWFFSPAASSMSEKAEKTEFIDNTARRKWDKEEWVLPDVCASAFSQFLMQIWTSRQGARRKRWGCGCGGYFCPHLPCSFFLEKHSLTFHCQVKNFSQSHIERAPLVERDYKVNVEDRVGKCVVITSATPKNEQGGFYCEVCLVFALVYP